MSTLEQLETILHSGAANPEEALQFFDSLEPVSLEFMVGRWQGSELHTNHLLNGLLTAAGWYGKEFIDPDCVHPLLFLKGRLKGQFKVYPSPLLNYLRPYLPLLNHSAIRGAIRPILRWIPWLFRTEDSQARIRMMEYRQKVSATLIYDALPIQDTFRKLNDDTVLGLMDFKGVPQPFFFVLKRESSLAH